LMHRTSITKRGAWTFNTNKQRKQIGPGEIRIKHEQYIKIQETILFSSNEKQNRKNISSGGEIKGHS